jgi:hypothetical protein
MLHLITRCPNPLESSVNFRVITEKRYALATEKDPSILKMGTLHFVSLIM